MAFLARLRSGYERTESDEASPVDMPGVPPMIEPAAELSQSQEGIEDAALTQLTFTDIAEQLEAYCEKAHSEAQKHHDAVEDLTKAQAQTACLESLVQQLRSENQSLRATINHQKTELSNFHNARTASQKTYRTQISSLNSTVQHLNSRNVSVINEHNLLQARAASLDQRVHDLQFDLELLRGTQHSPKPKADATMHLTPQPFVAVLVDGDAYAWTSDIFSNTSVKSPGAMAAIRLKNEVTKYILEHNIPPSKVIARVYINDSGAQKANSRQKAFKNSQKAMLTSFRVQFTEAIPLFDFVDVGYGKERADEKIRENFHLLLSNPYCHAIFLATCTDNGFARMLEPYQYHTEAYNKIVLVSPGYVEREIANLSFREVTWPMVFAKKEQMHLTNKERAKRQVLEKAKVGAMLHNQKMGFVGAVDMRVAGLVRDVVKVGRDGFKARRGNVGILGLRVLAYPRIVEGKSEMADGDMDEGVD